MLKNYLTIALRQLRRQPAFAGLNVAGLAVGLACCLLIALWVQDERSYDRFHTQSDRIYRLNKVHTLPTGGTELHALSSGPMAPQLVADYPEIEAAVRILPWWGDLLFQRDETTLPVSSVTFADRNLFEVFDFALLRGDPATALDAPLSLVLTESVAETFFGEADPIGQALTGFGELTYTVTGVVEDAPANSHLQYGSFVSWSSVVPGNDGLEFGWLERWLPQSLFTYVLLRPSADPAALDAKLPDFMAEHFAERADQYRLYLQPLGDVYLGSSDILNQRSMVQGNRAYVYVLSVVALLILLIACVNFMNLATARAGRRAVEVGVRKSVGARRPQLIGQFLSEAFLLVGLGLGLALVLIETVRPAFNGLVGKALPVFAWADPQVLIALAGLGLLVGLAAGTYPAFVLSAFRPARVLKGSETVGGRRFRQVLVTAQFAASIALLAGTLLVYSQMQFVLSENPGYDRDQLVVLPIGQTDIGEQAEAFRTEVLRHPGVTNATTTSDVPGQNFSTYGIVPEERSEDEGLTAAILQLSDTDLVDTYGLTLAAGRFFDPARPADSSAVVINEAMMRSLGWTEAVGKRFDVPGDVEEGTVVGVVADFQLASMHQEVVPLLMILQDTPGSLTVRLAGDDVPSTLAHLEATWAQFEPRYPFEYQFLDEAFARLYQSDRRLMQALGVFAALAVLVACLGLLGLAAYTAERRTKEIGVRKVLGAGVASIIGLLSVDFLRLVGIGFVVAAPLAWLAAERWLDGFAYRIDIGFVPFLVAGALVLALALVTVSTQALRAATTDPVKALRYE
ncbi:MAG: FtsX-like permease family protein [Rhodothermaceae bacterium]|nr:FtsX-like permease family protein [Rhodothermaceae bacterium]